MKRHQLPAAYGIAALAFVLLDATWLGVMTQRLYRPALAHLMAPDVAWAPAALFYVLYVGAIVGFAVAPALAAGRARGALVRGAALGLVAYASYDLSNQATLRGWPWAVTLADLAWGTVATGLASWITAAVLLRRRRR